MYKLLRPAAETVVGLGVVGVGLMALFTTIREYLDRPPEDAYSYTRDWLIVGGVAVLGTVLTGDGIETAVTRLERPAARH